MLISQVPEIGGTVLLGKQRRRSDTLQDNRPFQCQTLLHIEEDSKCEIIGVVLLSFYFSLHLVIFWFWSSRSFEAAWWSNQKSFLSCLALSSLPCCQDGSVPISMSNTYFNTEPLVKSLRLEEKLLFSPGVQLGLSSTCLCFSLHLSSSLVNYFIDFQPPPLSPGFRVHSQVSSC